MNSKFKLHNFRVFDDKGAEFEMAPITVLTGCNSSGKSSVLKSLMLLKPFLNRLRDDYSNGKSIDINKHELVFNKGKHNLGTFQKTVSKFTNSNRLKKRMTFSWTKYSHLLFEDLKIEIQYLENKYSVFDNAVIERIVISNDERVIAVLDFSDGFDFQIDYQYLKMNFFYFLKYLQLYNKVEDDLGFDDSTGTPHTYQNKFDYETTLTEKGREVINDILYAKNNIIKQHGIDELVQLCQQIPKEAIEHESVLYLPVLDWLKNISKNNVSDIILSRIDKIGKDKIGDFSVQRIRDVLKEFEDSDFESFSEFYKETIEMKLSHCFIINQKIDLKKIDLDKKKLWDYALWIYNFNFKGNHEVIYEFKRMFLEGLDQDFVENLKKYISLDNPFHQFYNFDFLRLSQLEVNQPSKQYWDFMALVLLCLFDDESFENKRLIDIDYQPIGKPVQFFEPKEYNAAVKYILAIIQDSLFVSPSFIENIEFVDAVRANVSRIYAFSQNAEFNELLVSYLNRTEDKKNISKFTQKNDIGFKATDGKIVEIFSKPIEHKEEEREKAGYRLGTFMSVWLKKFDIADEVIFENTNEGLGVLIYLVKNDSRELLADRGYGITQLLAILLKIETIIIQQEYTYSHPFIQGNEIKYRESTIAIEEPETNLHPKFQSLLAEMFMDAFKNYNIHLIIETHSEYLIRKLQTLVAKKELKPDDVALHYIYSHDEKKRPAGKPQVLQIKIKEDGRLSEPFGSGFFDEADNLAMDLLTLKSLN